MALRLVIAACIALLGLPAAAVAATQARLVRVAGGGTTAPQGPPGSTAPLLTNLAGAAGIERQQGTLLLASPGDHRVFGISTTLFVSAGNGTGGFNANDDPGFVPGSTTSAALNGPQGVGAWRSGGFLIADTLNHRIRFASSDLDISTVGGNGTTTGPQDGVHAASQAIVNPHDAEQGPDLPEDAEEYWLIADTGHGLVRKVMTATGTISTVAGSMLVNQPPSGSPTSGSIGGPVDLDYRPDGSGYWIAAGAKAWLVEHTPDGDVISAAGGGLSFDATGVVALADGGALFYDGAGGRIVRVSSTGNVTEVVAGPEGGAGAPGATSPAGTPAVDATFNARGKLALAPDGLLVSQGDTELVMEIPAVEIVAAPEGVSGSTASFEIASWDSDATFKCYLDNVLQSHCGPYTGLSSGNHSFSVLATTNEFVDSSGDGVSFTVDADPPADFGLIGPDDGAVTGHQPTFSWNPTSDPSPSSGFDRFELWVADKLIATLTGCDTVCSATPREPLPDGEHTWRVKAFDTLGNVREVTRKVVVAAPPEVSFFVAPERTLIQRSVLFDGTASSDSNGSVARFEWDLDGDGTFETDGGASPTITRSYTRPGTLAVKLRVTDSSGLTAVAERTLVVSAPAPIGKQLGVSINDGAQFTNDPAVTLFPVWPPSFTDVLVSNDGGFKLAQSFPVAEQIPWRLDSSGPERLPKTVYVRFTGGGLVGETHTDDIILDETAPRVLAATLAPAPAPAVAIASRTRRLRIRARDNVSGVASMQVTKSKRRPGKVRRFKARVAVPARGAVYVRVRDKAKNWSRWRKAR